MKNARLAGVLILLLCCTALAPGQGRPDPSSPRMKGVTALQSLFGAVDTAAVERFVEEHIAPVLRETMTEELLVKRLEELRALYSGAKPGALHRVGEFAVRVTFEAPTGGTPPDPLDFELEPSPPHRFLRIGTIGGAPSGGPQRVRQQAAVGAPFSNYEELSRYLAAETGAGRFSGVVLVGRGDEIRFHEAYGLADRGRAIPIRKDTKFNLGSLNKLFTAVAVYQLVERGALGLDDTLGKFLPQFPEAVRTSVTVRHLLEHRSGWGAYWDNPVWLQRRHSLRTLGGYMDFIKDIPLDFEPGTRQQYSNTGYEVLGAIIEKASGRSYYGYVRSNLFEPAGMGDTDSYEHDMDIPNRAIGYTGPARDEPNTGLLGVKGTAAGGGFSTAPDLLRFVQALEGGRLIHEPHASRYRGRGLGGGAPGVNTMLEMNVAGDHTVIVLSNLDPPAAEQVASGITQMLNTVK